ncbi:MAG TPA: PAC2 family protein [Humisphaera sp.]|jgi:proteasome assembly chaperone (PAC2) family protein|nr:PAC2 family protein [Humisphaera sp.]
MPEYLNILQRPRMRDSTMLLALSGWMDGGLVSTGTVRHFMSLHKVIELARIDPDPFYIFNFPGSMEIAAIFRPEAKYEEGLITEIEMPSNIFHCDPEANLVFFLGQEPNLRWQAFADCVFAVAKEAGVTRIIFMGSFGGRVPHTRNPRMFGSVSHEPLKEILRDLGLRLSDYQGPCGFSTLLVAQAPRHDIQMLSLVAEIPGYLQGANPLSIEAVSRQLSRLLNQPADLSTLRAASNEWEAQVSEAVARDDKLAATVRKLEEQYDNELIGAPVSEEHMDEDEDLEDEE